MNKRKRHRLKLLGIAAGLVIWHGLTHVGKHLTMDNGPYELLRLTTRNLLSGFWGFAGR